MLSVLQNKLLLHVLPQFSLFNFAKMVFSVQNFKIDLMANLDNHITINFLFKIMSYEDVSSNKTGHKCAIKQQQKRPSK